MENKGKDFLTQIKLINQALNAAVSSINLAKQLMSDISVPKGSASFQNSPRTPQTSFGPKEPIGNPSTQVVPGIVGTFDGQFMVAEDGQKFQVPENYASKSMIIFGDKLNMSEIDGETRFKQIERVKRQRASGLIVKKEGRLHVVTSDGSYRISPAAVSHFGGNEGDEAQIILPLNNRHAPFAAVESISPKGGPEKKVEIASSSAEKPQVQVEAAKSLPDSAKEKATKKMVKPILTKEKEKEKDKKEIELPKVSKEVTKDKDKDKDKEEKKVEKAPTVLFGDDELR